MPLLFIVVFGFSVYAFVWAIKEVVESVFLFLLANKTVLFRTFFFIKTISHFYGFSVCLMDVLVYGVYDEFACFSQK